MRLMIIGPQGAGKGTQAMRICAELGVPHISTGDLFRDNISRGSELGKLAQTYMDAGKLVPDDVTQQMVADRLRHGDAEAGFLFDGFPRNIGQAQWLESLLEELRTPIERVIELTAPDQVLVQRMLARGRADDTVEAINLRLEIYHAETEPLVAFYGDKVLPVDGVGTVDEVHDRMFAELGITAPTRESVSSGEPVTEGASAADG